MESSHVPPAARPRVHVIVNTIVLPPTTGCDRIPNPAGVPMPCRDGKVMHIQHADNVPG